ncbi:hypothetical protein ABPG73_016849 [Tetrahymena malaccensis]
MRSYQKELQIFSLILYYCLAQICKQNQIFDVLSQECLSCSSECGNCFNLGNKSCITCSENTYQSYNNQHMCNNQCQKNEIQDEKNQKCIKCNVIGCVKCESNQICQKCDQNLYLDAENNQCQAQKDICESNFEFIFPPYSKSECTASCPQSYYQNYGTQICEQTQQCPQIQNVQSYIFGYVKQVQPINQNQYYILSDDCSFGIVEEKWNLITKRILQEQNTFQYYSRVEGIKMHTFLLGNYGGCLQGKRLNIINLETLQIEFDESNLLNNYNLVKVDDENKFVFMSDEDNISFAWYNIIRKEINFLKLTDKLQNFQKIYNNFYLRTLSNQIYIGILSKDQILKFEETSQIFDVFPESILLQRQDFLISASFIDFESKFYKLIFKDDTIQNYTLILSNQFQIESFLFSEYLNLIIQYDLVNYIIQLTQYDQSYEKILLNKTIQIDFLNYVFLSENIAMNNTYILIAIGNEYLYLNLTIDLLLQIQKDQIDFVSQFQPINKTFSNYDLINIIIYQKEVQFFFSKKYVGSYYLGIYNDCIRMRKSINNTYFQVDYLNSYQFLSYNAQLYLYLMGIQYPNYNVKSQNQLFIESINQRSQFYSVSNSDLMKKIIVSKQGLIYPLDFLQKNPRILTKNIYEFNIKNGQYVFNRVIGNQYLIISDNQFTDGLIEESIFDLSNPQNMFSYQFTSNYQFSFVYYIQSKKILIIQDNFIVLNLSNFTVLANLTNSFGRFVNVDDIFLVIVNLEDQSLYQLDLSTGSLIQIYQFNQDQNIIDFMLVDEQNRYPVIFDNDLIYLISYDFMFYPYSLSKNKFEYQPAKLSLLQTTKFLIYEKSYEILVINFNSIQVYTYDLKKKGYYETGNYLNNFFNDKDTLYFCVFDYFYKFDMQNKIFYNLTTIISSVNQYPAELIINFYRIDDSQYFKKSDSIIDSKSMIIIKTQQEDNIYIGQMQQGDTQIHFFQSQNNFYWHKNLFNNPCRVYNLSENQLFLALKFENSQNLVAIYDKNVYQISIYNQTDILNIIQMKFNLQFDLIATVLDWISFEILYVLDTSFYLLNPYSITQNEQIVELDSKIIDYQVCIEQKLIVALTNENRMYQINIQSKNQIEIDLTQMLYGCQQDVSVLKFNLNCDSNLIIIIRPCLYQYNLETGQTYDGQISSFYGNILCSNPIVNTKQGIEVIYTMEHQIRIFKQDQEKLVNYQDTCNFDNTLTIYDFFEDLLINLTGQKKQILIIDVFKKDIYYIFKTTNQFDNNLAYYFQQDQSLIVIDSTPIIYLVNCLTNKVTTFTIQVLKANGIIMDEIKNIIFLYSSQFIYIYQYPDMTFIETITLQKFDQTPIQNIYLDSQLNLLIILTQSAVIQFDLAEVLYTSEVNLTQYQNIQNLVIDEQYQVYYSLVNYSLNLFSQANLVDYLILQQDQYNIYPYFTQLIAVSKTKFFYVLFNYFYLIEVDTLNGKLLINQKLQLQSSPDSYFFDEPRQQVLLFYQKYLLINYLNLKENLIIENNLAKQQLSDFYFEQIIGEFIIFSTNTVIYAFNILSQKFNQIVLQNKQTIQFIFKLQSKEFNFYQESWWNIPFDYEERYNTNDYSQNAQISDLICVVSSDSSNYIILIVNITSSKIQSTYLLQQTIITNIVNDPFRKFIYVVTNKGKTHIFDWSLNYKDSFLNPCIKQAVITFDQNFIYSVCPTDIKVINGLSFQQQFPTINKGIVEAVNIISINYNNYFLILQKYQIQLVQLQFNSVDYKILFQKQQKYYLVQFLQLQKTLDEQYSLSLILSSQSDIEKVILPLSPNNLCSLTIQQQNRTLENIYTQTILNQTLLSFQSFNIDTQLQVIEIIYLDQQCIETLSQQLSNESFISTELTLINESNSLNSSICWQNNTDYDKQIANFQVRQMSLNLDNINLNQNAYIKTFQMSNIVLKVNNSLILQNFERVHLQNIQLLSNENQNLGQINIQNCQSVVVENFNISNINNLTSSLFNLINNTNLIINNLFITSINPEITIINNNYVAIFNATNTANITINKINVLNSSNIQLFQVNNSNIIHAGGLKINQSQNIQFFQIYSANQTNITDVQITGLISSTFLNTFFSQVTYVQKMQILNSTSVKLISLKTLEIDPISYICEKIQIKEVNLLNTDLTKIFLQVDDIEIEQFNITQMYVDSNIFDITTQKLSINQIKLKNITSYYDNIVAFNLIYIQKLIIDKVDFWNNHISFLFVNQQLTQQYKYLENSQMKIFNSYFINNTINLDSQLMLLNSLQQIQMQIVILQNNALKFNVQSSFIQINQCYNITITSCQFEGNLNSLGYGGSLLVKEVSFLYLVQSKFLSNKCLKRNGGALHFVNTEFLGVLDINFSEFIHNQATSSTGGAISIQNVNLILQNTQIDSNIAQIGGGVYYQQFIPDFIILTNKGYNLNNTIQNNYASIYGKNIGSTLRKIVILQKDIFIESPSDISYIDNSLQIQGVQSGEQIIFQKIQIVDEEGTPLYIPSIQTQNNLSDDVQIIIRQISVQITCDQTNIQMECEGYLKSSDFQNGGFSLKVQPMYKPLNFMVLRIQSNPFPQLIDSQNNIYNNQGQLELRVQINFGECLQGQIQKQFSYSFYCARGYQGIICNQCDTYGKVWDDNYAYYFTSKNCQQCQNNVFLIILNNFLKFFIVISYVFFTIRSLQKELYIRTLGHYVAKSGLIFLCNSYKQDKPRVYSKLINDHLQILSIVYGIFNSFIPISIPIEISGNPLNSISKSIDCLFAKYPDLQPLWFYQLLWSFVQPMLIILLYFIIGIILYFFKRRFFLKRARAALVFIYFYYFVSTITILSKSLNCVQIGDSKYLDLDLNIKCFDPQNHLPCVFFFCLPLLIIYGLVIPLVLWINIYFIQNKKASFFVKIQYSYIVAGYKNQLYYWEFYKIIFKISLIMIYILLRENQLLQVSIMNIMMSLNFFLIGKLKPYIQQIYNDLQQRSILLCIITLNLYYIQQNLIKQTTFETITTVIVSLPNLYLFIELIFGIIIIRIQGDKESRNIIQNCLLALKEKYPKKFLNIHIVHNKKTKALLKLKVVQKKFQILLKFLKNYNFYNQEQFLVQFNLESQSIDIPCERRQSEIVASSNLIQMTSLKSEDISVNPLKQKSLKNSQLHRKFKHDLLQQTLTSQDQIWPLKNTSQKSSNPNILISESMNFETIKTIENNTIN